MACEQDNYRFRHLIFDLPGELYDEDPEQDPEFKRWVCERQVPTEEELVKMFEDAMIRGQAHTGGK